MRHTPGRTAPKHAIECRHRCERQQNCESGVDARPTTSPLPSSRDVGVYTTDDLIEKDGNDNTRRWGYPCRFDCTTVCSETARILGRRACRVVWWRGSRTTPGWQ